MKSDFSVAAVAETGAREGSYDRRTILLHWVTAGLVGLLWSIAQVIDLFPKGPPRIAARSVHIMLGLLLGVIVLTRIAWRIGSGRKVPPANDGVMDHVARIVHIVLYVGLVSVVLLGISNTWARGDSLFGLLKIPKLYPQIPQLKPTIENLHATFASALLILAAAHALVAAVHHFILHDGVLRRMLPRRNAKANGAAPEDA
jgi:cytochrome b561